MYATLLTLLLQPTVAGGGYAVATIEVTVHPEAVIFVDGTKMKSSGRQRLFESPPIKIGMTYSYEFRVLWPDNGVYIELTKKVSVSGGETTVVDFYKILAG